MAHLGALPPVNRYIQTHTPDGISTFSTAHADEVPFLPMPNDKAAFTLTYGTAGLPVNMSDEADIETYTSNIPAKVTPALTIANGMTVAHVDLSPGNISFMHRTQSLDYAVLLEGSLEVMMEDGQVRGLKRGDTMVMRGGMHAWRNPSETEWARFFCIMVDAKPVEVGGKVLEKEFRAIPDAEEFKGKKA